MGDLRSLTSSGAVAGAAAGTLVGALDPALSGAGELVVAAYSAAAGLFGGAALGGIGGALAGLGASLRRRGGAAPAVRFLALCAAAAVLAGALPPLVGIFSTSFRNRDLAALTLAVATLGLGLVAVLIGGMVAGLAEIVATRIVNLPGRRALALRIAGGVLLAAAASLLAVRYGRDLDPGDARAGGLAIGWLLLTVAGAWLLSRRGFRLGRWPWWGRRALLVAIVASGYATYQMASGSAPSAVAAVRARLSLAALALAAPEEKPVAPGVKAPSAAKPPAPSPATPATRRGPKPTILLITLDATRPDHLSLYGYERATSPKLQAFAQQCAVFERAYAASSAERDGVPGILSGRLPSQLARTRQIWPRHHPSNRFLADVLAAEGYRSAAVVAHDAHGTRSGLGQGFERVELVGRPNERNQLTVSTAPAVAEHARTRLAAAPADTPYLLWTHFADAHALYLRHGEMPPFGTRPVDRYDGELAFMDEHLGALLEATASVKRPLFVVIAGDHGEAFGEHGRTGHGRSLWEEEVRVPLVVCGPGVTARRIARPVSVLDLYPTLLDLAGASAPKGLVGTSLLPMLRGGPEARGPVLLELPGADEQLPTVALVDGKEKLVLVGAGRLARLFDLEADPAERRNVAGHRPESVARMRAAAEQMRLAAFGSAPAALRGKRRVVSATEDAAEKEALKRSLEAQKRRDQADQGTPPVPKP